MCQFAFGCVYCLQVSVYKHGSSDSQVPVHKLCTFLIFLPILFKKCISWHKLMYIMIQLNGFILKQL